MFTKVCDYGYCDLLKILTSLKGKKKKNFLH